MATELLYLRDAYLREFTAVGRRPPRRARSRSTGRRSTRPAAASPTTPAAWAGSPSRRCARRATSCGTRVDGDAARGRHRAVTARSTGTGGTRSMRTHTALHVLCGVIWNEWRVPVTGGNMEPLSARMDFEFDPLPEGFGPRVEELVNAELAADRPIEVEFLPRGVAAGGRGPDPHEGQHDPGVGRGDPRGRHRRARQAGRRRDPRAHARPRSDGSGSSRPRTRARATSGSGSRWSMAELAALTAAIATCTQRARGGVQRRGRLGVPGPGRPRHARARTGPGRDRGVAVPGRGRARRLPRPGRRVGPALVDRGDRRDGARRVPRSTTASAATTASRR